MSIKNEFKKYFSQKSSKEKGIALLLALFCVMIISFMAVEISFDTSVEYVLANKEFQREKAYAAARAGVELSLLRLQLFKNVTTQYAQQLKGQQAITQMIWSFPFTWPPSIPQDASMVDKDQIKGSVGASLMEAHYAASISSEGSKLDLNDLDSPSDSLKKSVHAQILKIFQDRMQNDEEWASKHRSANFEELVNNLQDWVSDGTASLNGGDKRSKYPQFKNFSGSDGTDAIPPNRPFQTLDEVRMVAGMTEELYQMLLPHITVYGIKAINVNQADKEILKSIDPVMNNEEIITKVMERRSNPDKGGPFKDVNDLMGFVGGNAQNFNPTKIPLYFGNEYNFRIRSIGEYNNVTREIIAIVYDVTAAQAQLKAVIDQDIKDQQQSQQQQQQQQQQTPAPQPQPQQQPQQQAAPANQKPRIVFWWEN